MLATLAVTAVVTPTAIAADQQPTVAPLELAWDAVPEPNVVGYRIHIGTSSGQYSVIEETGTDANFTVVGLELGATYYFAVSAFNDQGLEGALSDELTVSITTPPLPMDAGIVAQASGDGGQVLRWSFPQSALSSSPEIIIQQSTDLATWTEADTVWSGDYHDLDGGKVNFEWPLPMADGGSMFYRLTARNWLGESTQP